MTLGLDPLHAARFDVQHAGTLDVHGAVGRPRIFVRTLSRLFASARKFATAGIIELAMRRSLV